jgi:hypothetical protein
MSSEILPHAKCSDNNHNNKNKLKKFVMHNIGNQDSNILGKDVTANINRNKA